MNYINTATGEYPVSESTIRAAYPNTSFPVPFVAPEGYVFVFPTPQPEFNPVTQRVQETTPVLTIKGHYEQQWEVQELFSTQAEKDAAIAADIEAKRKASVPSSVTMRQARLALLGAGLLARVDAAINGLPSPQKEAARIEWEYATEVQRSSGLVPMMRVALGLDDAALDALFIGAAAL